MIEQQEERTSNFQGDPDRKTRKLVSRRTALGLLFFGSVATLATGAGIGAELMAPGFWAKVRRSVEEGKVIPDIEEIIASRIRLKNDEIVIQSMQELSGQSKEAWMHVVSPSIQLIQTTRRSAPDGELRSYLLVDITTTTEASVLSAPTQGGVADLVIAKNCLTLPSPQYRIPQDRRKYKGYEYLLFAEHSDEGLAVDSIPEIAVRGGVVLANDGFLRVVSPEDMDQLFKEYRSSKGENVLPKAIMEYAFIIDSNDLVGSFKTLDEAKSGALGLKDLSYSVEYMNLLVSMYDEKGVVRTFVFCAYESQSAGVQSESIAEKSLIRSLNLHQVVSLMQEIKQTQNMKRFVIAVPDPSEVSSSYVPELGKTGGPENLGRRSLRTIGSPRSYEEIDEEKPTLPWILVSRIKKIDQ